LVRCDSTGNGEAERGPLAGLRFHPDAAAVPLHDLFAKSQADARAGVLFPIVQALEDDEDALAKLRVDADAVVAHGEGPVRAGRLRPDLYQRLGGAVKLDGIANQVLKQLHQLHFIAQHGRQRAAGHHGPAFLNGLAQIDERLLQDGVASGWDKGLGLAAQP